MSPGAYRALADRFRKGRSLTDNEMRLLLDYAVDAGNISLIKKIAEHHR